jgi:hypothetical protein
LGRVGSCDKVAIEGNIGDVLDLSTYELKLYINPDELRRYSALQSLLERGQRGTYMVCGGRAGDALAWSRDGVNMAPTCGRHVRLDELHHPRCAWYRSKGGRYWWCPECKGQIFSQPNVRRLYRQVFPVLFVLQPLFVAFEL